MKPYIQLVIFKQWLQFMLLFLIILASLVIVGLSYSSASQSFKFPITIQDLDQTNESKALIHKLQHTKYMEVKLAQPNDIAIEDDVNKKVSIISMQIPKGFAEKLADNHLKGVIQLYGRDDFVGSIALEIVSSSLYQQQIPNIIYEHLNDLKQHHSMANIEQTYTKSTPTSKIKFVTLSKEVQRSLTISVIFAIVIVISSIQVVLHQRLNQLAVLQRLKQYHHSYIKLYSVYILSHVALLTAILIGISIYLSEPLTLLFYIKTILLLLIYELGIALILFRVNTLSHRLFMTLIYSLSIGILYVVIFI